MDEDANDPKSVCPEDMTQIRIKPNWPQPKVTAKGVVKDKDGNIKFKITLKED